jgi:hypothetical protein
MPNLKQFLIYATLFLLTNSFSHKSHMTTIRKYQEVQLPSNLAMATVSMETAMATVMAIATGNTAQPVQPRIVSL